MNEAVIREKLMEICEAIDASNDAKSDARTEGTFVSDRAKPEIDAVVDHLRLQIKYMMFDLEASRRENRYLRQMLEIRPPQSRDGDDEDRNAGW